MPEDSCDNSFNLNKRVPQPYQLWEGLDGLHKRDRKSTVPRQALECGRRVQTIEGWKYVLLSPTLQFSHQYLLDRIWGDRRYQALVIEEVGCCQQDLSSRFKYAARFRQEGFRRFDVLNNASCRYQRKRIVAKWQSMQIADYATT